jgi:hypothetical protein
MIWAWQRKNFEAADKPWELLAELAVDAAG